MSQNSHDAVTERPRADPPRRIDPAAKLYLLPRLLLAGREASEAMRSGSALPLAGTLIAFASVRVLARSPDATQFWDLPAAELRAWIDTLDEAHRLRLRTAFNALCGARPRWCGLDLTVPSLMGIVNVTPDSFSDGGAALAGDKAAIAAKHLWREGAAIVDMGAESTRPGSDPVSEAEERKRLAPPLAILNGDARPPGALLSIDTRRAEIMREAIAGGADIINDVSALQDDPHSLPVLSTSKAHIVLMHRQGVPKTMNIAPSYSDVLLEVYDYLEARIEACVAGGIARARIAIDPGFGFGKRGQHNQALLQGLALLHGLGCPLVIGLSRKSFSRDMEERYLPVDRLPATLTGLVLAAERGAQIFRVHDVAATRQALDAWLAIMG